MAEETFVKTILTLERLRNSGNGNPRYRVTFTDGESAVTQTDASIGYGIGNPEFKDVPVRFTVSKAGRITHAEPVKG